MPILPFSETVRQAQKQYFKMRLWNWGPFKQFGAKLNVANFFLLKKSIHPNLQQLEQVPKVEGSIGDNFGQLCQVPSNTRGERALGAWLPRHCCQVAENSGKIVRSNYFFLSLFVPSGQQCKFVWDISLHF